MAVQIVVQNYVVTQIRIGIQMPIQNQSQMLTCPIQTLRSYHIQRLNLWTLLKKKQFWSKKLEKKNWSKQFWRKKRKTTGTNSNNIQTVLNKRLKTIQTVLSKKLNIKLQKNWAG